MFTGEQAAGATETRGNLVGDQQRPVFITQAAYAAQVFGVIKTHGPGPLQHGLQYNRRHLATMFL